MLRYIPIEKEDKITRLYTLNETNNTISAHPAKFSPHDKFSIYRIKYKEEHNIFPFEEELKKTI